jgi:hypothetical protein
MSRFAWIVVGLAGAVCGCVPNNFVAPNADKSAAKPLEPQQGAVHAPVTAAQINADNAREKAKALRDEMDRDLERAIDANDPKK